MRVTSLAIALASLASLSCTAEAEPDFHGDIRFSAEERARVERGNSWLSETIGARPVTIVWDLTLEDGDPIPPATIARVHPVRGVGEWTGESLLLYPPSVDALGLELLAAHELGHYRGLPHHDGEGLMKDGGIRDGVAPEWTVDDERVCVAARVCRR